MVVQKKKSVEKNKIPFEKNIKSERKQEYLFTKIVFNEKIIASSIMRETKTALNEFFEVSNKTIVVAFRFEIAIVIMVVG